MHKQGKQVNNNPSMSPSFIQFYVFIQICGRVTLKTRRVLDGSSVTHPGSVCWIFDSSKNHPGPNIKALFFDIVAQVLKFLFNKAVLGQM